MGGEGGEGRRRGGASGDRLRRGPSGFTAPGGWPRERCSASQPAKLPEAARGLRPPRRPLQPLHLSPTPQDHRGAPGPSPAEDPWAPPHGPPPPGWGTRASQAAATPGLLPGSLTLAARSCPTFPDSQRPRLSLASPRPQRLSPGPAPELPCAGALPSAPPIGAARPRPSPPPGWMYGSGDSTCNGPRVGQAPFFLLPEGDTWLQPGSVGLNTQGPGRLLGGPGRLLGNPEERRPAQDVEGQNRWSGRRGWLPAPPPLALANWEER